MNHIIAKMMRDERRLTQKELSEQFKELGYLVSQSSISKIESGDKKPNIDELKAYSEFFHMSADYLLGLGIKREAISQEAGDIELKSRTVTQQIEDVKEEICNHYCHYPYIWDEDDGELADSEICANCPLGRL